MLKFQFVGHDEIEFEVEAPAVPVGSSVEFNSSRKLSKSVKVSTEVSDSTCTNPYLEESSVYW